MPNRDDMMRLPFDPIVPAVRADTERRREDEKRVPTVHRDPKLVAFETQRHEVGGGGSFDELVREYIRSAASNHMETWREKFLNMPATAALIGVDRAQGPDQTVVMITTPRLADRKSIYGNTLQTLANTPQAAKPLPEIPDVTSRKVAYDQAVQLLRRDLSAQEPDPTIMLTYRRSDGGIEKVFIKKENQSAALRSLQTLVNTPQAAKPLPEIPDVKPRGWLPLPEDPDDLRGLKIRWIKRVDGTTNRKAFDELRSESLVGLLRFSAATRGRIAAYSTDWECPND